MPAQPPQRSYLLLGAALALPIIVLVILQVLFAFNRQREDVERQALARAEQVTVLAMARVEADFALMRVLATADPFERADWPSAYARTREVAALNPHWRNVIVTDTARGVEIFSLRRPFGSAPAPINPAISNTDGGDGPRIMGGAWREGPGCPCVYLHTPVSTTRGEMLISVALDPSVFRSALMRHVPEGAIAAIVDANGNFIARSLAHDERIGTPATRYVRDAVASGARTGVYPGTTLEGLRNYSAFYAAQSGWSTHIAMASNLIERPRAISSAAVVIGSLIALIFAAAMIFFALRDLTQRRQAEARLAQTQKLEAVGQLTGGVAHDFNNLLTVIIGGLNMLLKRMEDPKQRQIAEHMLEAAQRGDKLTKQLLAFSRGKRLELAPVDLHAMVHGMEELMRRSLDAGVALSFRLHPDARWVMSDLSQLELAVLNLVINARDAMPEGGRIDISTAPGRDKHTATLTVTDNGMGMPKEVLDRALEPFFTTKPAGKGTGLGLAQVYGAARQSGGSVEIESAPGKGARFIITLPRTQAPPEAASQAPEPAAPAPAPAAGKRVLVVDDEPGVRAFMAEALRGAGYDAIEAADVGVALRLLETDRPDLLLTDYSMPGMNGLELAERASQRHAGLRVLIVSGYADADRLEASAARPTLLRKPFDETELLAAVRAVLIGQNMMRALIAALLLAGCATAAPLPATLPEGAEAIAFDGRALTRPALPDAFIAEQEALLAQARAIDTPQHPQQMADAAIWIGRRLGYVGRYREAIAAFEDGAARFPEDPRFLRDLGHRFITVRQLDDAITTLTRAEAMTAHSPDEIEPDGLPNTANTPTSTLKGNIAYHLGLAHYLRGDFPTAARVFQGAVALAANADAAVAARYWLYLALARSGNLQAAKAALAPIQPDWPVHEESAYFWLTLCFSGQGACDTAEEGAPAPQSAAIAYGLAAQALIEGHRTEAHAAMRAILTRSDWASFGYIAAEADLAR